MSTRDTEHDTNQLVRDHLDLVGRTVAKVSARYPRHVDREELWNAGALGLVIVGTIGYSTARLGLVTVLTIIVAAQFITGAFLDHFGVLGADLRPLNLTRISGIGLLLLGTWLVVR